MRLLVALCAVLACLGTAPAFAQEPTFTPDPDATEQVDPEETPDPEGTATPGDEDPYATPGCDGPAGTDTDYSYCGCRGPVGTEGDYVYCAAAPGGSVDPTARRRTTRPKPRQDAIHAARTLPASLPLTGGSPLVIALTGFGFVLIGAGGRLRLGSSPAYPTPSG